MENEEEVKNNSNDEKSHEVTSKSSKTITVLFVLACCGLLFFMVMYFYASTVATNLSKNVTDLDAKLHTAELNYNNTINTISNNITTEIISNIILYTDNCSVITVTYLNNSRQLADIKCIESAIDNLLKNGGQNE